MITEYVIHKRNLKQALNHGLVLKKIHEVIKFNENAWLKSYNDMNTDLRKKAKNDFKKDFFQVNEYCRFWKNYGKCNKTYWTCHNRKKIELLSIRTKLSYYKVFHRTFISNRNNKNRNTYGYTCVSRICNTRIK